MKKRYSICLMGCDDSTTFTMELTDAEADVIKRACDLSEETSTYGCMPTMSIDVIEGQ